MRRSSTRKLILLLLVYSFYSSSSFYEIEEVGLAFLKFKILEEGENHKKEDQISLLNIELTGNKK